VNERHVGDATIEIPPIIREDVDREFFLTTSTLAFDSEGRVDAYRTMRNEGVRMAWVGLFQAIERAKRPIEDTPAAVSETAER